MDRLIFTALLRSSGSEFVDSYPLAIIATEFTIPFEIDSIIPLDVDLVNPKSSAVIKIDIIL